MLLLPKVEQPQREIVGKTARNPGRQHVVFNNDNALCLNPGEKLADYQKLLIKSDAGGVSRFDGIHKVNPPVI